MTRRVLGLGAMWMLSACAAANPPAQSPAPLPAPPAAPTPPPPDERAMLRASIDSMLAQPDFRTAQWGVLIVDPARGDTLYSHQAGKLFMPASNQKLLTTATALTQLGPDFRFRTSLVAGGPRRGGTIDGDLLVVGTGDPTVSDHMRGDAMQPLLAMADSLTARGVTRIRGRVLSGRNTFPDSVLGWGWAWDDLDYSYSAGIDELLFNEGFSRVIVKPGARVGKPAQVTVAPSRLATAVRNEATTVAAVAPGDTVAERTANTIEVTGYAAQNATADSLRNVAWVRGTIPLGDSVVVELSHRDPDAAYLAALTEALLSRGIKVDGRATVAGGRTDTLLTVLSPPLDSILPPLLKPSQNQLAEVFFKTLGLERTGVGTADSGRAVVTRQLLAWGARPDGFAVRDGSGLSRHDYVSPETIVQVLDTMRRSAHFKEYYDALPIAGVDGTIRNRMKGTPAEGNVHAKTGTLDKARSLSGYVTTADGHMLLFSFLCNNWQSLRAVDRVADTIAARLAAMHLSPTSAAGGR